MKNPTIAELRTLESLLPSLAEVVSSKVLTAHEIKDSAKLHKLTERVIAYMHMLEKINKYWDDRLKVKKIKRVKKVKKGRWYGKEI